jgi:hypothetical protein
LTTAGEVNSATAKGQNEKRNIGFVVVPDEIKLH